MSKTKAEPEPYLTYDEAEAVTGIPAWKLRKWVWAEDLPCFKPDGDRGRTWLRASEIHAFMESRRG